MDGMAYLVGQIAVPLVLALLAGVVIGHLAWPRRQAPPPVQTPPARVPATAAPGRHRAPAGTTPPATATPTPTPAPRRQPPAPTGPRTAAAPEPTLFSPTISPTTPAPVPPPSTPVSAQIPLPAQSQPRPEPQPDPEPESKPEPEPESKSPDTNPIPVIQAPALTPPTPPVPPAPEPVRDPGLEAELRAAQQEAASLRTALARLTDKKDTEIGRLETGAIQAMETTMANNRARVAALESELREVVDDRRRLEVRVESEQRRVASLEKALVERDRRILDLSSRPAPRT